MCYADRKIVLTSTYLHTQGVGAATEKSLWQQGARTWDDFLELGREWKIGRAQRAMLTETVQTSRLMLADRAIGYFARALPRREHWRALGEFANIAYVDIETDGGSGPGSVTVVGVYDGFDYRCYLRGRDLDKFETDIGGYESIMTFCGGTFDLPVLAQRFPRLAPLFRERIHVDLCPLYRRIGCGGGLKAIERRLNIPRTPETEGLNGFDAVRLWQAYIAGGRHADDALRLLIAYNREDVVNLPLLFDRALPRLRSDAGMQGMSTE